MDIKIKEVKSNQDLKTFISFPNRLYAGNDYYVPALYSNEFQTLSDKKNPAFEFCMAKYWLAFRDGEVVGRVAGIINHRYNEKIGKGSARFGWLDFVENEDVLQALMRTVEKWAISKGAEFLHGPLGFVSFDPSGILVEGFDQLPTSFARYNYPYYPDFIEKLGYVKDVDWLEYNITVPESVPEKYTKTAEIIKKRYHLRSVDLKRKKDLAAYADRMFQLLNREYKDIYSFTELTQKQIDALKKQFVSVLRLQYVSLVVDADDQVVGFGICMPSLSKALQKSGGKLYPFGFLRILHALYHHDTVDTLLIAVHRDYRDRGVNAIIFDDIGNAFVNNGVTNIESNRELEDNYSVSNMWKKFEYRQNKRARCYYKALSNNASQ